MEEYSPNKIYHHQAQLEALKRGGQIVPRHLHLIVSDLCNQDCSFCLIAGTLISTPDGLFPIEDISVGDTVYGGNLSICKVSEISQRLSRTQLRLEFKNGKTLTLTPNHEVATQRGWVKASDLSTNDYCTSYPHEDGFDFPLTDEISFKALRILKITEENNLVNVYNFTCPPDHSYIANDIVVHNCAYRMSDYPTNELFKVINADGSVNNNPNRMLSREETLGVLSDAAYLGFKAIQFSLDGKERLPLINPKGEFVVLSIEDFVNQFFTNAPSENYETSKVEGWKSYAINDSGQLILDEVTDVYRHPSQEDLTKITLEDGRTITCTQSHSLNVIRNDVIQKIPIKDIRLLSDKVASVDWNIDEVLRSPNVLISPSTEQKYLEMPEALREYKSNPVNSRIYLTPDFFRLLGYFAAEGASATSGILFCFGNGPREDAYRADVISICENVFGVTPKIRGAKVQVDSVKIKKLFDNLGLLVPQISRNVPNIVWTANDLCKKHFLAGLFAGDGNFRSSLDSRGHSRNSLHLKTCNSNLSQEVATLLRQLQVKVTANSGVNKKRKIEGRNLSESTYFSVNVYGKNNLDKVTQILNSLNAKPIYQASKYSAPGSRISYTPFGEAALALRIKSIEIVKNDGRSVYDITVKNLHRFLTTSGIGCFNTGGGESTLHPNIQEFFDESTRLGLEWALVTNGTLLHKLNVTKASWVRISIDAAKKETYASIRRINEKIFDKIWENVKNLQKEKSPSLILGLGFVVTKENYLEIEDFCNMAHDAGVDNVRLSAIFQTEDSHYFDESYPKIKEQIAKVKSLNSSTFKIFDNFGERYADLELGHPDYSYCGYQHFTTYLGADGNLYRCCNTAYNPLGLLGSIKDKSFKDLISSLDWDKGFDAHSCPRCMFNNKNKEILYALSVNPKHVNFV